MKDLLQKAFEYGQKFEGRGGDENYSFEQFLADNNQALQLQQGGVSGSVCKDYQFLFDNYTLTEEEQNWCRTFENSSGLEPIETNISDKEGFIGMAKYNIQHCLDLAEDTKSCSEQCLYKLSYYDEVVFG